MFENDACDIFTCTFLSIRNRVEDAKSVFCITSDDGSNSDVDSFACVASEPICDCRGSVSEPTAASNCGILEFNSAFLVS